MQHLEQKVKNVGHTQFSEGGRGREGEAKETKFIKTSTYKPIPK